MANREVSGGKQANVVTLRRGMNTGKDHIGRLFVTAVMGILVPKQQAIFNGLITTKF
jgi:hypothetical protein